MRWLTWLYAGLALGLCAWLALHFKNAVDAEPRALLDEANRSMGGPEVDYQQALILLGQALDAAEAERDVALIEEILLSRARLLRVTGGYSQARADLERILTHYRPGSPGVEAFLAAIDLDAGEPESALARATSVIARDPNQFEAWGARASALIALGERHLDAAREKAGLALAEEGLESAERALRRIGVLDLDDPRRARYVAEFVASFPVAEKARSRAVLEELDDASALFADVPNSLAQSMRGVLQRQAAHAYMNVLADAGETESAIAFGLGVARLEAMASYPPFLRDLMEVLARERRYEAAAEVVRPQIGRYVAPDPRFYLTWCDVLYRSGKWHELLNAASLFHASGDEDGRSMASFYLGIGLKGAEQDEAALRTLESYAGGTPVEPFPGAVAVAWDAIAALAARQGDPALELDALERRIRISTDATPGIGEAWLRASELAASVPPGNRASSLERLTQALRLLPERRVEIEARWRELGDQVLRELKIDLGRECDEIAAQGAAGLGAGPPEKARSGYEMVRLAETFLEREERGLAISAAHRALAQYPDLLPALEALGRASLGAGDSDAAARALRRRLELDRSGPRIVEELLAALGPELLREWGVELVRLDPQGLGRRWAAEHLRDSGRIAEAIEGLERVPDERRGDSGRVLLAELLYEQGQEERAQQQLAGLSAEPAVLARALPLMIDIGVVQRDKDHLRRLGALLEARETEVDADALLACVDHMLREGLSDSARELIERLDSRPKWRNAELYVRRAQVEMLEGDLDAAQEAVERALPYDETGSGEMGLLLLAVERREWSDLPERAAELLASGLEPSPMQYVAIMALGERLDEARTSLQRSREQSPEDALWPMLGGALAALGSASPSEEAAAAAAARAYGFGLTAEGALQRDPRPLLARLLALGSEPWSSWAIGDLSRQAPPNQGALWPTYLAARGFAWLGESRAAETTARKLADAWPTFAVAWDMLEEAISTEVKRPDHPRLLRLYELRRKALGDAPLDADGWLLEARMAEQEGELDRALEGLDHALGLEPDKSAAWRRRAQILRKRREWAGAITAFRNSLERAEPETDSRPVAEFIGMLEEAANNDRLVFGGTLRSELDFLGSKFPRDPAVALAQARWARASSGEPGRDADERALTILDRFRLETKESALDDLRDGSASDWIDLELAIDPERAYRTAEGELARLPASVALWRKLAEVAARTERRERAIVAAETAVGMLPDAETATELALLAAENGESAESVRGRVEEARRIAGADKLDRRLQLATVRALLHGGRSGLDEALAVLAQLWNTRDPATRPKEHAEVGSLYGIALCWRGDPKDRDLAREVLLDVSPRLDDPTRSNLLIAMASMARFIAQ